MPSPPEPLALTAEQLTIVEAAQRGERFKVAAFAGTGKTTTLTAIARALPGKNVLYIVFNRAQQLAAETRFAALKREDPRVRIEARTAHSMAWRLFGRRVYAERLVSDEYRVQAAWSHVLVHDVACDLATHADPPGATRAALDLLKAFIASDATSVGDVASASSDERVVAAAGALWSQLDATSNPVLPVTHDVYLKAWQLTQPRLPWCETIMYDEAQDATPAMLAIVAAQAHVQTIYVGDEHQQIYEFRGAKNALASLALPVYALTETWRFGERIAAVANAILAAKREPRRIAPSRPRPDAVHAGYPLDVELLLARTNAGLVEAALRLTERGASFFFRGPLDRVSGVAGNGFGDIRGKLLAAYDLWNGKPTTHPAFASYLAWDDLKRAAADSGAEALRPYVRLVEAHQRSVPAVVARLRDSCVATEAGADVVLSTVHRFKGEEAASVTLAADYRAFSSTDPQTKHDAIDHAEANLAYVAVTRARRDLWAAGARATIDDSLAHAGLPPAFAGGAVPRPVRPLSATLAAPQTRDPLVPGRRYRHPTFGIVTVVAADAGTVRLVTADGSTKTIAPRYVRLTPAETP